MTIIKAHFYPRLLGPMSAVYSLVILYIIIAPIVMLYRKIQIFQDPVRSQLKLLCFGLVITFTITLSTNLLLPVLFNIDYFNGLGPFFSVILTGFMVYIISNHQFLDLRPIIQRSLIYTTIFSFIVVIYAAILSVTTIISETQSYTLQYIAGIVAIVFSVITVPSIDMYLRRKTDAWLFVDTYNYQVALGELSATLQSSLHMDTMLDACAKKVGDILRVDSVSISPEKTSAAIKATLVIPIKLRDKLIGTISLGEKKSGLAYTNEDKELLHTFATQAATAISRVFLYQEIKQKAEELEEKVMERTAELTTAYDEQSQLMLHISHNLQTPLAILRTKLDKLDSRAVDTEAFTQTLDQVSVFIQQLLRLARLEHTEDVITTENVNISALLLELVEETTVIADMSDVTISHKIENHLHCNTNAQQVREIIMNLLSNALKYIGDTAPKNITVQMQAGVAYLDISVTDTGIGIAPESQTAIFERFSRTETTTAIAGTGLGLAITKQLTEQIGGTIEVKSVVGEGSTFIVRLPMK